MKREFFVTEEAALSPRVPGFFDAAVDQLRKGDAERIVAIYARSRPNKPVRMLTRSRSPAESRTRAFALGKEWTVPDAHIYADDAVSGAETRKLMNRQRLIAAIERGDVQAIVMRDASRLNRRAGDEAFGELKRLRRSGAHWSPHSNRCARRVRRRRGPRSNGACAKGLADWRTRLQGNVAVACEAIRALLTSPIKFTSVVDRGYCAIRFEGRIGLAAMFAVR